MEDFSRAVARVVAAQIAESAGFDACQDSAVEILADLLLRYLGTLAASSHSYAELAGRSQANLADLLLALEEVGVAAEDLHSHMQQQVGVGGAGAAGCERVALCNRQTSTRAGWQLHPHMHSSATLCCVVLRAGHRRAVRAHAGAVPSAQPAAAAANVCGSKGAARSAHPALSAGVSRCAHAPAQRGVRRARARPSQAAAGARGLSGLAGWWWQHACEAAMHLPAGAKSQRMQQQQHHAGS